ncbi:class I SAM-dependent methyltransferase [Altibacter lentus]|uniref:class I SAM-dependent methyltransferase n=1 Tax=Altibacter lentus TaxID=1223410 RepID=UPI0005582ACD|nr:class I SAM-dependent methyltransferase [Altibacter lentus]
MRWITLDDFIDIYSKVAQRGGDFFLSKFTLDKKSRTKSAFDDTFIQSSNWWIIPKVRKRWNTLITGDPDINYKQHFIANYCQERSDLRLLSLGAGTCSHELELARYPQFAEIVCVDLAENRLAQAKEIAEAQQLSNIHFVASDLNTYPFAEEYFDIVLFNASLHHFEQVEKLLTSQVNKTLKPNGYVVINEYVGPDRLQYPKYQIKAINNALKSIDPEYRKRFKTRFPKNRYYGSGVWRMIMADPSECVDSAGILPALHAHFITCEEKGYGGNILMSVLKDISHHFVTPTVEQEAMLQRLFDLEDTYLTSHDSDFVFGVYQKK